MPILTIAFHDLKLQISQNLYFIIILSTAKALTIALFKAKRSLSFLFVKYDRQRESNNKWIHF